MFFVGGIAPFYLQFFLFSVSFATDLTTQHFGYKVKNFGLNEQNISVSKSETKG